MLNIFVKLIISMRNAKYNHANYTAPKKSFTVLSVPAFEIVEGGDVSEL